MINNILIVLSGPVITLYLAMSGKNFKYNSTIIKYVVFGAIASLVVSLISHHLIVHSKKANIVSVVVSLCIFAFAAVISGNDPETKMWLPVILLFLPLFYLPTAISISIGIGRIMKPEVGQNNHKDR